MICYIMFVPNIKNTNPINIIKMAITQNFNIGRATQSLGNTTFSQRYGKNTLRTRPISTSKKVSSRQLEVRNTFSQLNKVLTPLMGITTTAYKGQRVKKMSPINKIMRYNLNKAIIDGAIDWNKFELCTNIGDAPIENITVSAAPGRILNCTWEKNSQLPQELSSPIDVILINRSTLEVLIKKATAKRAEEKLSLTLPPHWQGLTVTVFLQCQDFQGKEINEKPLHLIFNATSQQNVTIH